MGEYRTNMYLAPELTGTRYEDLIDYALSIDGYAYADEVWGVEDWLPRLRSFQRRDGEWRGGFEDLRCCLFLLQRRVRWKEQGGPDEDERKGFLAAYPELCRLRERGEAGPSGPTPERPPRQGRHSQSVK